MILYFMFYIVNHSVYDHSTSLQKQPPRGILEKKVFRKYAANLQENTHGEVRFQ